ncbi:insulin receptor substrate 1 isoform X1 [Diorhabda carinulata]|uniref:insulin receptor substrate 1 isoform X1 n=1 Tax=Diorhabda carinulata TaxID=1163345 RepID=UPI0025A186A2|nr:insulin receptor substrate 1 isoform X1 [Diorhabda carinulata]
MSVFKMLIMFFKSIGQQQISGGEVLRCGLYKKLKTLRKKWFVLRAETPETSARLEYYDSEKKFLSGQPPKRSIVLKTCFNINRRKDTKYKHVIALYTKDDCFCVVLDTEEELESWLKELLSLQHGEEDADGEPPKPTYEHVWDVTIVKRGLGWTRSGNYRLCLSSTMLCLVNQDGNSNLDVNFMLWHIRSCGILKSFFFLELGRYSPIGAGEFWITSIDSAITQNMHAIIYRNMGQNRRLLEMRVRSSSATESSKPAANAQPVTTSSITKATTTPIITAHSRERCDSMPSRTSEGTHLPHWKPYLAPYRSYLSRSPPVASSVSPPSIGCSTDSTGSTYSISDETTELMCVECSDTGRYNNNTLTPEEAIAEEDCPETSRNSTNNGYVDMACRNDINSPATSVSSIVSGTPSTDIRFSDYPLEKVCSYLICDEDDARPARAYSFGSKPETSKTKKHVDLSDSARVRAFSMGSNAKKWPSRILHPHHHPSLKSTSAPLLSNTRSHSSHSSSDRMDDLMELDFSKGANNAYAGPKPNTTANNGYVEMKLGVEIAPKHRDVSPYVDMSGSAYMDMSGSSPSLRPEQEYNSFVDISRQYKLPSNNNYVVMDARRNRINSATSPTSNSDYFDMSSGANNSRRSERGSSFSSQLSNASSPRNNDYLPMSFSPQDNPRTTPEGYVEMSMGKKHQRQGSLDGCQSSGHNDDYLNMSVVPKKKPTKNQTSQPISILPTAVQTSKNSSMSFLGRKSSTGTPPKMHLPLSSWSPSSLYSSLPRTRARKDSKDSSSSSVTTPSSSSTIFPLSLNSPSSPLKANKPETPSSKITASILNMYKSTSKPTPSEDYAVMDYETNRNEKNKENTDYVNFSPVCDRLVMSNSMDPKDKLDRNARKERSSGDYAVMQPVTGRVRDHSDRRDSLDTTPLIGHLSMIGIKESQSMCFQPIKEDLASSPVNEVSRRTSDTSDYMELGVSSSSSSSTTKISRPNSVNGESRLVTDKPRPSSVSLDNSRMVTSRPSSTTSEQWSSSSTLVNSRPESVNSDTIKDVKEESTQNNRLVYASLDLVKQEDEEEENRAEGSAEQSTFVYAEIDFVKSEGLKQNNQSLGSAAGNAKVKH